MTTESEQQLTKWINQQNVTWAAFTLKSPRISNRLSWEPLLKVFFTELGRKYVKSTVKKHRSASDEPLLHRVVWMGGDNGTSTAFHSQGLVELHEEGTEKLEAAMNQSWQHTVKNYFKKKHPVHIRKEVWMSEAKVWVEKLDHANAYSFYLNRFEGNDLGFGVQKIVLSATSLKPFATCILKPC